MTPEPGGSGECLINFQLHPDSLLVQKTGCRVLLSSSPKGVPQKTGVLLECPNNPSVGSLGLLANFQASGHDHPGFPSRSLSQGSTCVRAKLLQSCLTLCDPIDSSPPGSSVHGILQVRILERVAMPSSRGSSQPRDRTCMSYVSCLGRRVLYHLSYQGSPKVLHQL